MPATENGTAEEAATFTHDRLVELALAKMRDEPDFRDRVLAELYAFQWEFRAVMMQFGPMLQGGLLGKLMGRKEKKEKVV